MSDRLRRWWSVKRQRIVLCICRCCEARCVKGGDERILVRRLDWQLSGHHQTTDIIAGDCKRCASFDLKPRFHRRAG